MSFDVVVVGGGTAGITAALTARYEGARVALVERSRRLGGDCTFTGCVPSKTLVEIARLVHDATVAAGEGILESQPVVDFARVCARRARVVEEIAEEERDERCTAEGIRVLHADARFTGPRELTAGEAVLTAERFVIATGSEPLVPPGLEHVPFLTNETIFDVKELPRRLLVLGGGTIGLELGQAFRRLGSEVTVVEMLPKLLPAEEPEVGELAAEALRGEGVELHLGAAITGAVARDGEIVLALGAEEASGDTLLVAAGRRASVAGLGLEEIGVELEQGYMKIGERCRTSAEHVFAAGDVTGGLQFTHVASHEGRVAGQNAAGKRVKTDYRVVPSITFLDPEIARVGLTEAQARERHSRVQVVTFPMDRVDRARIVGAPVGFVKLVTASRRLLGRVGGGELVGAQIVGPRAGELIHECVLAMKTRCFAGRLAEAIHAYPSASMAVQQAGAQLFPLGRALVED